MGALWGIANGVRTKLLESNGRSRVGVDVDECKCEEGYGGSAKGGKLMVWREATKFGYEHMGPSVGMLAIWYGEKDVVYLTPEQTESLFELLKKMEKVGVMHKSEEEVRE